MNYIPSRRLFLASVALALLALAVLAGCALDPPPPPTPTPLPPTPTPLPRGGNLTIRLAADVPDLRPWQPRSRGEEQLTSLLYNGLTHLDAKLQPQPDLSTGWDASQDGRLITFTLRTDVTWHDGKPLYADDHAAERSPQDRPGRDADEQHGGALDDRALRADLRRPSGANPAEAPTD